MPASMKHLTDKKLNLTSLLARWKDGLYYTAAIVKCEKSRGRCLVCFEDGSELWVHKKDLHIQLTADQIGEPDDIVCCVCDEDDSDEPNVIVLCDICNQAYHQKCHRPEIDSSVLDDSDDHDWICATCSYILNQSNPSKLVTSLQQQQQLQQPKQSKQAPQKQPQQSDQQPREKVKPKPSPAAAAANQKQAPKIKESLTKSDQTTAPAAAAVTVPFMKAPTISTPKQTPYYPLSGQVRAATSSTAALASMTASSASIVGSPAGRTKQDLVNQSNRSSQRQQQQLRQPGNVEVISAPPVKHAVRKSSVNFSMPPVRQSALPTATRSMPSSAGPPAKMPRLVTDTLPTSIIPIGGATSNLMASVAVVSAEPRSQSLQQVTISNNSSNSPRSQDNLSGSAVRLIPRQPIISSHAGNISNKSLNQHTSTLAHRAVELLPVSSLTTPVRASNISNNNSLTTMISSSSASPSTTLPSTVNNNRGGVIVVDSTSGGLSSSSSSHSSSQQNNPNTLSDGSTKSPHPTVIVSVDPKRKDNPA